MEVPVRSRAVSRSAGTQYWTVPAQFKSWPGAAISGNSLHIFNSFLDPFCALCDSFIEQLISMKIYDCLRKSTAIGALLLPHTVISCIATRFVWRDSIFYIIFCPNVELWEAIADPVYAVSPPMTNTDQWRVIAELDALFCYNKSYISIVIIISEATYQKEGCVAKNQNWHFYTCSNSSDV